MSVEAITWALRQPVPLSSAKFVLVVLANCASADTALAYPSVAYLSEATSQDRKTVIANLRRLAEWALIEDTGHRRGDTRQIIVYRVRCGGDLFTEQGKRTENGTVPVFPNNSPVFPREQSRFSAKESQKRDTEPSEPSRKREARAVAPAALDFSAWPSEPSPQVLADWLDLRKRKRAPVTATAMRGMGAQLHRAAAIGYDVDAALTECVLRGWQGLNADWLQPDQRTRAGPHGSAVPSKTLTAIQKIEGMKHGLAGNRTDDGTAKVALLGVGSHPGK